MTEPESSSDEAVDFVRHQLTLALRGGYEDRDVIALLGAELLEDEEVEHVAVEEMIDGLLAELQSETESWPATTDNDRLAVAFTALTRSGIAVREDFLCCQTCANAEIAEEMEAEAASSGREVEGYVYFHRQDTESAIENGALYLSYGWARPGRDPAEAGSRVRAALRDAGLTVDWDGSPEHRIRVPIEWRRREALGPDGG